MVVPDAFTASTLTLPRAHARVREATQLGVLVAVRMLHVASRSPLSQASWDAVLDWSRSVFAATDSISDAAMADDQPPLRASTAGVLALALAALLAHQYTEHRSSVPDVEALERVLQDALAAAERLHSFYHVNVLLRALTFHDASHDDDAMATDDVGLHHGGDSVVFPFTQPMAIDASTNWQLPPIALTKHARHERAPGGAAYCVAIVQRVGADLLNDVLGSLGYLESVGAESLHQLHAMVKLVTPVLANASVAEATLSVLANRDDASDELTGHGLAALVQKTKALLPASLLPCLQVLTALSANVDGLAPSPVLRHVLKELAKPLSPAQASALALPRLLPPDDYLAPRGSSSDDARVVCVRSFYYEDDQLAIPAGTTGRVVDFHSGSSSDSDDEDSATPKYVLWHLDQRDDRSARLTVWDLVFEAMETAVAHVQTSSLRRADDMETLTSVLEWIVQASRTDASVVHEIGRRWSEARLRSWWCARHLPSLDDVLPLLLREHVSLSALERASREDLVAWGVRDRSIRDHVLAHVAPSSRGLTQTSVPRTAEAFALDGVAHLVRLLFGFLDSFLHELDRIDDDDAGDSDDASATAVVHFVSAILSALNALTSVDACVRVIIDDLGGGSDECVGLVLTTARKVFESHERLTGHYPVVLASLDVAMNVVRWFLAQEARAVDASSASASASTLSRRDFAAAERTWCVGAVEFAVEILSTHESWKFAALATKWELTDRCFRVLYALLAAAFVPDDNAMLQGLQTALRKTLTTDVTLVMKLLRSTCGVVSIRHHALKHWNSISAAAMELEGDNCVVPQPITRSAASSSAEASGRRDAGLYPLTFATELDAPTELARLEALAVTALRLLDLLLTPGSDAASGVVDYKTASLLLLTPIDDGGPKARKALNLVTLCGGYLAYPVTKRRAIVAASLQILHHAAVFLERRDSPASSSSDGATHSLSALFQGGTDMASVRDAMLRLLRSSLDEVGIGKALLALLTTCLTHQPGFLAYVLFDVDEASDESTGKAPVKTQRLVALIERFLVASEQLMEEATDLFCHVLQFLVRVWHGATRERRALDVQIVQGLRASSHFWGHLTRALKIRMALDASDGHVAMSAVGLDSPGRSVTDRRSAYVGRSSPFAYVARGYILQIISYEWHARGAASKASGDDALTQVLETFRTEDLYSHWLRTFTRLDYAPSRFAELCRSVQPYASAAHRDVLKRLDATADDVPAYARGLLCDASVLAWQLDGARGSDDRSTRGVLQRVQWCNLQSAYVQAQGFALSQWKVFMELCCFLDSADAASEAASAPAPAPASPAVNRFKRKESMISSPPRLSSTARTVPASPLDLGVGAKASSFAGDRTSFGMIQVLADVLSAQQTRDGDAALDLVGLAHVHDMLELLVSMLHHQLRQVVTKTRDPKLSQTRPRPTQSRVTLAMSVRLLRLVEKTAQRVELSLASASRLGDRDVAMRRSGDDAAALWPQLASDFANRVESISVQLRTALLTAALLLVRHVVAVSSSSSGASDSVDPHECAILHVKLVQHCMRAITQCDALAPRASAPALQALFQVSWCLIHDVLDGFVLVGAPASARLDRVVTLRPLVTLLEHEQHGLAALFQVLIQRFRVPSPSSAAAADDVRTAQTQALQVLTGLTTVVWNAQSRDLWRRVLIDAATSELRVLPLLANELVPLLSAQMAREDAVTGLRGYVTIESESGKRTERSVAHQMWCALLRFAAGLLQLVEPASAVRSSATGVWELLARGEPLLLAALEPSARLTHARVDEQTSALVFLNAVSRVDALKAQWKQGLPRNWALLLEQSRLALRRACVLLGSSLSETKRHQQLTKTAATVKTATVSFAHQTLLHEHLEAVEAVEKRALSAFYRAMERQLAALVRQAAALLLKWTASLAARDVVIVVDGVRRVDAETLVPLLALAPPTQSMSMSCAPSLGHVCLAMDFGVAQLEANEANDSRVDASALSNTVDTCALLLLKTLVLHLEQFDCRASDVADLQTFVERLVERVRAASAATAVDDALLDTLARVCALREA